MGLFPRSQNARPLPCSPVLSLSQFFLPLLSRVSNGFLRTCTEIEWERRPFPPCALGVFDFVSFSYVLCFVCDDFWFSFV